MQKRRLKRCPTSAELLKRALEHEDFIALCVWSDGSATITVGLFERYDIDVPVDIWEDFNLRYNFYDVVGCKPEKIRLT